ETATVGEVIGYLDDGPAPPAKSREESPAKAAAPSKEKAAPAKDKPFADKSARAETPKSAEGTKTPAPTVAREGAARATVPAPATGDAGREDRVVAMSPIRRRIAERLVEAQQTAALLTTFNEIDMSVVVQLRRKYRDSFQEAHGVKLGFMSFFVKA